MGFLPAYEVPRVSRIPDSRLGCIQLVFYALVLFYTLFWVLINNKRYLSFESPDGTARLQLQGPAVYDARTTAGYGYCAAPGSAEFLEGARAAPPSGSIGSKLPCQFRDEYFALYPEVEKNALFASTLVKESEQTLSGACANDTSRSTADCVEWQETQSSVYYVTALEDFTVLIDHSFVAPLASRSASAADDSVVAGWICGRAKETSDVEVALGADEGAACTQGSDRDIDPCADYTRRGKVCPDSVHVGKGGDLRKCKATGCKDIMPLRTLLRAAGITDLDKQGDYKNKATGVLQSHRYAGLILHVNIVYTNHAGPDAYSLGKFNYHYEVQVRARHCSYM